jgi:hypothetical protein
MDMSDEDISLDEKRVYTDTAGTTTAFVGTATGVVRVSVSDDIVGEFSLEWRGEVIDIAATERQLAISTPEDVFVRDDGTFQETGFGSASAVGYDKNDSLLAAGDGRLERYNDGWEILGSIDDVRAIDGEMVAAGSGVYRLDGTHVGLDDVHDIATAGTPLAATESGLYYLANGWVRALEGNVSVVASDGRRSHAATAETLYATHDENEWATVDLPVAGTVRDVAYSEGTYAVTEDGTFLANAGDGWRHRSLGVLGISGMTVP